MKLYGFGPGLVISVIISNGAPITSVEAKIGLLFNVVMFVVVILGTIFSGRKV